MSGPLLSRRAAILGGVGGVAALGGCGEDGPSSSRDAVSRTVELGDRPAQQALLTIPEGKVKALAVLIHGGGWLTGAGPAQLAWVANAYEQIGVATWNIGYRGLETGGGWPATFEDVAAAMDEVPALIKEHPRLKSVRSMVLGQSAGAHLGVWAASRTESTPGGAPEWLPDSVVSLSGPLMLTRCATEGSPELAKAITLLMGGTPGAVPSAYALADPVLLMPQAPIHVVQGLQDPVVPAWNATGYVAAVKALSGEADLTMVDGGHSATLDARAPGWPQIESVLNAALGLEGR